MTTDEIRALLDGVTPGPWGIVGQYADASVSDAFSPVGGCGCCDSPWMNGDTKEQAALNAMLINAAPAIAADLLEARAEVMRLRAQVERLMGALKDIARQKKTDEQEYEYDEEYADFEGGYDACIDAARAALAEVTK